MTATDLIRAEIRRFLESTDPEAVCLTGKWGVAKTYTWDTELRTARSKGEIGLSRYSYGSLFGINSLEGLKLALFENLEFLDAPADSYKDKGTGFLKRAASAATKYSRLAEGLPAVGQFLSKAGPLYFSAIQNQIWPAPGLDDTDLSEAGPALELHRA